MYEVEVKFRVGDRNALLGALNEHGVQLGEPVRHDDQAYAPPGWRAGDSKLGVPFLRLRTAAGRHWFTLKQPAGNVQSCLEHETEIVDREAMHAAILCLGYWPAVRIVKTRRTAGLGSCLLAVDDVDGAGCFIELERMIADADAADAAQDELAGVAASFGVSLTRTFEGYDALLMARLPSPRPGQPGR
jgi:adenylate cyclase, class 2